MNDLEPLTDRLRELMASLATAGMEIALGRLPAARRTLARASHELAGLRAAIESKASK